MQEKMQTIIAILGPTSSGKSDLAIQLARKFNGEIVSADSRQVYRGLDLLTGKVTKQEQRMVHHHCLDIVDPPKRWKGGHQPFSIEQYRRCADVAIEEIWRKGKIPFFVGGSQLYVRAVLYDYDIPAVAPDGALRKKLEKKSLKELQRQLYSVDSIMCKWGDRVNKRRVIRALEIYHVTGQKPSRWYKGPLPREEGVLTKLGMTKRYNSLQLCIDVPRDELYRRIDDRVDMRIRRGMIREIERLREDGISKKWLRSLGLEARFISEYLDGKRTEQKKAEMIERLKYAIHDFARRQLMWYRKDSNVISIRNQSASERHIRAFLKQNGNPS